MKCTNIKNRKEYERIGYCMNSTNGQDDQKMVLYKDENGEMYCREEEEFFNKFITDYSEKDPYEKI